MIKLNRNVSRLVLTAVIFSAAASYCGYLAWTGTATTRPLWSMIAVLVAIVGGLAFECYRSQKK